MKHAYDWLLQVLDEEGPFDGFMGFSAVSVDESTHLNASADDVFKGRTAWPGRPAGTSEVVPC